MSLDVTIRATVSSVVYEGNITHNLGLMAQNAGLYLPLWRPEELGIRAAGELVPLLKAGLFYMRNHKKELEADNPSNGWGCYQNLLDFTEQYLAACIEYPQGEVSACR
jgi:hypothetical protein